MDSETSSNNHVRDNKRRTWNHIEENRLIGALKEIVVSGLKVDNGFKAGYLHILEDKLIAALLGTDLRGTLHIESKIKAWRKQYSSLVTMLSTTGFGWNNTLKMIEVESNDVLNNYLKRDPNAALMCNKHFVLYDDWCIIFGKDHATGEYVEGPTDVVEAMHAEQNVDDGVGMQPENTSLDDLNFSPSSKHDSTRSKDKRATKKARGSDGIVRALTDFVDRFGTYCEKNDARMEQMVKRLGYHHDLSDARKRVNE